MLTQLFYLFILKLKEEEKKKIAALAGGFIDEQLEYFKISILEVSALLRNHAVLLKGGFCFVSRNDVIYALLTDFKKRLKANLKVK